MRTLLITAAALVLVQASMAWAEPHCIAPRHETGTMPASEQRSVSPRVDPAQVPDLDTYLNAHFESLDAAPVLFPVQALSRFKQNSAAPDSHG